MTPEQEKRFYKSLDERAALEAEEERSIRDLLPKDGVIERISTDEIQGLKRDYHSLSRLEKIKARTLNGETLGEALAHVKIEEVTEDAAHKRVKTGDLLNDVYDWIVKADTILDELKEEYLYTDMVKGCRFNVDASENKDLFKLVGEYGRLVTYFDIASDYVTRAMMALEERPGKADAA